MRDERFHLDRDIPYLGDDRGERMDVYRPVDDSNAGKRPAVVIIHGGGWFSGSKDDERQVQMAETLVVAGYVCANIDYRLATPDNPTWPGVEHECQTAVRFLRTHAKRYGVDPARIGAIGGSAGGTLSLLLGNPAAVDVPSPVTVDASQSARVSAIVALYPPTDMMLWKDRLALIGFSREQRPDLYRAASPVNRLTPDFPPTLLLHGTADTIVDHSQSVLLADAMAKLGVRHELITVEGAPHTFLLKSVQHDFRAKVVAWFDAFLKAK